MPLPKPRLVYLFFPPLLAVTLYFIYVIASNFSEPENFSWIFLVSGILLYYCYLWIIIAIEKTFENKRLFSDGILRAGLVFITALILCETLSMGVYYLLKSSFIRFYGQNDQIGLYHLTSRALGTFVGFLLVYSVYRSIHFYNETLVKQLQEEQYEREKLELQHELLHRKLDPHFLFNNLNTLHTMISDSDPSAEDFVVSLSRIMRYNFRTQGEEPIGIREEISVLSDYVLIMKKRFGNALTLTVNNPEEATVSILPMTLLNLMENTVKHNEISREKPLHIRMSISGDCVEFSNNRNRKRQSNSSGDGLKHLQAIYRLKYDKTVAIRRDDTTFTVTIPNLSA